MSTPKEQTPLVRIPAPTKDRLAAAGRLSYLVAHSACTLQHPAGEPVKTLKPDILARQHWAPYTSPNTMPQQTSVPARYALRWNTRQGKR
jgi:hypothetical protein